MELIGNFLPESVSDSDNNSLDNRLRFIFQLLGEDTRDCIVSFRHNKLEEKKRKRTSCLVIFVIENFN